MMSQYHENSLEEAEYLRQTLEFLHSELHRQTELLKDRKTSLRASGKEMWEESVHFTEDFEKLTEVSQHLSEVSNQAVSYRNTMKQVDRYKRMLDSPYFGRFDFKEEDCGEEDKIYIGMHNAMDPKTQRILVYDWRAPVSSIFYQYELGSASYPAPFGKIDGTVLLKRQYKIQNSQLQFFFDCSIKIDDEMLQEILCRNSSSKMKNIVETIQREQDRIIRDVDHQLLIVQGVAGSGKTSIALHRIAFLLYQGLQTKLQSQNILILSPNGVFNKYISSVLPELGEDNVNQTTFGEYTRSVLEEKGDVETRGMQLEALMECESSGEERRKESMAFKGSKAFVTVLDRFITYYERRCILFEDVHFDGKVIEPRQLLKNRFLDNKIHMPAARRLERMENILMDRIRPLQKKRLPEIEKKIQKMGGHEFEIKAFSRLLSIKEAKNLRKRLRMFTEIDYYQAYQQLFKEKGLLRKLASGITLPDSVDHIVDTTRENLEKGWICYEDCAPLLYLKLRLEGSDAFADIKQVVIDEAQDYTPVQYEVFNLLFFNAGYTVLGDVNQSMEKAGDPSLYDIIADIFKKKKWAKVTLNRSYRSSYEITAFAQKLLQEKQDIVSFERHEEIPAVIGEKSQESMVARMLEDIESFREQGYESIAIVCKTVAETATVYEHLKDRVELRKISSDEGEIEKGIVVIPSYMAKGLEFDVVLIWDVSRERYHSDMDRRMLYIACTRALHRLGLYYVWERSGFL